MPYVICTMSGTGVKLRLFCLICHFAVILYYRGGVQKNNGMEFAILWHLSPLSPLRLNANFIIIKK